MEVSSHERISGPADASATSWELVIAGLIKFTPGNPEGYNEWYYPNSETSEKFTVSMTCDEDETLPDLWKRLKESGYIPPTDLYREDIKKLYSPSSTKFIVSQHEEVVVVGNDKPSTRNSIRLNETLIAHANAHYSKDQAYEIKDRHSGGSIEANCTIDDDRGFEMSLERTPRMPDDDKLHQLPGSLGSFQLYNVHAYQDRLPKEIADEGGIFCAMWQREALWLNFKSRFSNKFAVRVFVGHVNAISGLTMEEQRSKGKEDKGDAEEGEPQDYLVIPGQKWLDGICVAPGIVRQFVAMPLGSGYTVEGQKTSEEKHGGLQIEIIPEYDKRLRWWRIQNVQEQGSLNDGTPVLFDNNGLVETCTPEKLECRIGDKLWCYPEYPKPKNKRPLNVYDILTGKPKNVTIKAHYPSPMRHHPTRLGIQIEERRERRKPGSGLSQPLTFMGGAPIKLGIEKDYVMVEKKAVQINSLPMPEPGIQSATAGSDSNDVEKGFSGEYEDGDEDVMSPALDFDAPEVEMQDLKAMGLAAGGKLIQDIYKDPYAATVWNHDAARIIHIHILDPDSFEKVTHIVPRPPPVDAKAYAEAGGAFFVVEEKPDDRIDGGDFENVKSVSQMDAHVGVTTEPDFDPSKPKMCTTCEVRLCDCIVRPCNHQFCNVCIKQLEREGEQDTTLTQRRSWKCPTCSKNVARVAGFSAPMNLPGEEPMRIKVPVNVLKIEDGRVRFSSIQKTRI